MSNEFNKKVGEFNMITESKESNPDFLKIEADNIESQIIAALKSGSSFRVEAGAGSGKTFSLNKAVEWIQANKWTEYSRKKQKVACITYTNAAVDVIADRLPTDTFVIPSTIHSFAWNSIKQYQHTLVEFVTKDEDFVSLIKNSQITEVTYTLGHRYVEKGTLYLHHDDVLNLFCRFLDMEKFRHLFANQYPLILIDEYQDSYKPIIDRFIHFFIAQKKGPQFAFFGDAWQTIYKSFNSCGLIEHENLKVIKKGINFRSAPKIVEFLNALRPELPQCSAVGGPLGEVVAITNDDYTDQRRQGYYKGDLPEKELQRCLNAIKDKLKSEVLQGEQLKILMITHKVLAKQQGYELLLKVLKDRLRNKEDQFLIFFMDTVEPVFRALQNKDTLMLFDVLGIKRYPITRKSEKLRWGELQRKLEVTRRGRAIDVLELIIQTKLIPVPPQLIEYYKQYFESPEAIYAPEITIKTFLDLEYAQFISAIEFLNPGALFSTQHGVKGEEYDNVLVVIGRGWHAYNFDIFAPMITGDSEIPKDKQEAFEDNRNLFYVCCSRAKKRLYFFITVPLSPPFEAFLNRLVGSDNIYTFSEFVKR